MGATKYLHNKHCSTIFGPFLFIIGGRLNDNKPSFDVFSFNTNRWHRFGTMNLFRHSLWIVYSLNDATGLDVHLYIYGGFEGDSNSTINSNLYKINIKLLFTEVPELIDELEEYIKYLKANNISTGEVVTGKTSKAGFQMAYRVVLCNVDEENQFSNIVKSLSVTKLPEESRKINRNDLVAQDKDIYDKELINTFSQLMPPMEDFVPFTSNQPIVYSAFEVITLIKHAKAIFEKEPIVLKFKSPIKIYGSIHGQYNELLRYFYFFGKPSEYKGDIESFRYLFLGNMTGRGLHSVELMCLLLMLKIKFHSRINILRGAFEDIILARDTGLAFECQQKFKEDPDDPQSVFQAFCSLFEYLPIAAVIDGKVLCVHSIVGDKITTLADLEAITKPYTILDNKIAEEAIHGSLEGIDIYEGKNATSEARRNVVRYQKVCEFLKNNALDTLIRGHDIVSKGFHKAEDKICSISSVSNYMGSAENMGVVCVIKKSKEIQFKSIIRDDETSFWYITAKVNEKYPSSPVRKN